MLAGPPQGGDIPHPRKARLHTELGSSRSRARPVAAPPHLRPHSMLNAEGVAVGERHAHLAARARSQITAQRGRADAPVSAIASGSFCFLLNFACVSNFFANIRPAALGCAREYGAVLPQRPFLAPPSKKWNVRARQPPLRETSRIPRYSAMAGEGSRRDCGSLLPFERR